MNNQAYQNLLDFYVKEIEKVEANEQFNKQTKQLGVNHEN